MLQPFHHYRRHQKHLPPTERLLLPIIHSILLQRQLHAAATGQPGSWGAALLHDAAAVAGAQTAGQPGSWGAALLHDAAAVAGAQQTSPAGPVGATVDVAAAAAAAALYECGECGRAYSTPSNLARHRQSHRATTSSSTATAAAAASPAPPPPPPPAAADHATGSRKCPHCDKV